jgi:mevalonate kinase
MDPLQEHQQPIIASAPGKIILFGEHVVVHGRTAIATSLDLRTYAKVETQNSELISLELPDINVQRHWKLAQLEYQGNCLFVFSLFYFSVCFLSKEATTSTNYEKKLNIHQKN